MNTREQIQQLQKEHPNWSKSDIARAVVPPVSPQRVGQIVHNTKPDYKKTSYRIRNRHRYHVKGHTSRMKPCPLCD